MWLRDGVGVGEAGERGEGWEEGMEGKEGGKGVRLGEEVEV